MIYIGKGAVRITVNLLAILWVGQIPNIEQVRHSIKNIQKNGCGEKKKFQSSTGLERGKIIK